MNNNDTIKKQIESLGFTRSLGTSLYKLRRKVEYWVQIQEDESITFESFQRYGGGKELNYKLKFSDVYQFQTFAEELLKFAKKEVLA